MKTKKIFNLILAALFLIGTVVLVIGVYEWREEKRVLKEVIARLKADTRRAEVLVTKSEYDETTKKIKTTIKFLEYDTAGKSLAPKYFTFDGNILQFQSFVIRFNDKLIEKGDALRGKSVALFMKAFALDGKNTQEFEITQARKIPRGYQVDEEETKFESNLWKKFWDYALSPKERLPEEIKNAQIEAPGTMFLPGSIYTLYLENDGGLRIDSVPVPEILKGEKVEDKKKIEIFFL